MKMSKIFSVDDEVIIKPIRGFVNINVKELWRYRELFLRFTWRDLKVRYKQTIFGILWAIIPPVLSMIVFSLIFGRYLGVSSGNVDYPIFVYSGTLIWTYFSSSLTRSSNSLLAHRGMIQKIYFPRLILPLSSIMAGLVDFSISFIILLLLMIHYQVFPSVIGIILIPLLLFITILSALGLGLILSSLNVRYRDIGHALPFAVQLGFFLTPVIYPVTVLQEWSFILWLNPMTSVIENARAGLLGTGPINWTLLLFSLSISILLFVGGLYYFRRVEKDFADII